jgi:hypothetical protein
MNLPNRFIPIEFKNIYCVLDLRDLFIYLYEHPVPKKDVQDVCRGLNAVEAITNNILYQQGMFNSIEELPELFKSYIKITLEILTDNNITNGK